jgi:tetratricopeptide (TPR) repeat protein
MSGKAPSRTFRGKLLAQAGSVENLVRAGRHDEAATRLRSQLATAATDHAAWYQLARVENHRRRFGAALKAVNRALEIAGEEPAYRRFKGILLANQRAGPEAIAVLATIVEQNPADIVASTALQIAHYWCGHKAQAIELGTRILEMEDEAAGAASDPVRAVPAAGKPVSGRRRKVVAFSLWGAAPLYNYGAMINARLARFIYPGWDTRFYLGSDVPGVTRRMLEAAGAEVVEGAKAHGDVPPAMWRFLVADDPGVSAFLCRDCDARLSPKEAAAVDAWLRSGRDYHVMRDHILHRNVMLAGLWGGRNLQPLRIVERVRRFLARGTDQRYGADQRFLAREVWPAIRGNCLLHDSHYTLFGAQPFPVLGRGDDRYHVGMAVIGEKALQQEAALFGLPWPLA